MWVTYILSHIDWGLSGDLQIKLQRERSKVLALISVCCLLVVKVRRLKSWLWWNSIEWLQTTHHKSWMTAGPIVEGYELKRQLSPFLETKCKQLQLINICVITTWPLKRPSVPKIKNFVALERRKKRLSMHRCDSIVSPMKTILICGTRRFFTQNLF